MISFYTLFFSIPLYIFLIVLIAFGYIYEEELIIFETKVKKYLKAVFSVIKQDIHQRKRNKNTH